MINTIIFDLGGVLINWDPQNLYRRFFENEDDMADFLQSICTADWNEEQDAGRSLQEGTKILVKEHPRHEKNIRAYYDYWEEMLAGPIEGTVEILKQLKKGNQFKIYALTNWSAETFPKALKLYDFLNWFDGVVVSGTEKMRKPSSAFYKLLLDRYNVRAEEALFVDDNKRNTDAAQQVGIDSIVFTTPETLVAELQNRGIQW